MTMPQTNNELWERSLRKGIEFLLILTVLAIFPYTSDPAGDLKYLLLTWGGTLIAATWLIGAHRYHQTIRRPALFLEIILLFLALNLGASLLSEFTVFSLVELRKFWVLFLIYLVASNVYKTPQQIRRMMLVVCIAVAIASAYALFIQKTGVDPFPWGNRTSDEYLNLPATFGNPNYAAHVLILAIIMALYLATRVKMIWCLGLAALFMTHLHFTQQRGGLVALAGVAVLLVVAKAISRLNQKPVKAVVTTLLVVAALGAAGLAGMMALSKYRTGSAYPLDLSLLIRYKSYCSATRTILDRPILGHGPGVYKIVYPQFWTPYEQNWFAQERKMNAHVHNDLLEVATDAGLPAAGLYLAILVLAIGFGLLAAFSQQDGVRRRLGFTFAAFFSAFLIDGCFGFNLRLPVSSALLFVMLGALDGFWSTCEQPKARPPLPPWTRIWQPALLAIAAACTLLESAIFLSQALHQRGLGQLVGHNYREAEFLLAWGEKLQPWQWDFPRQRGIAALGQTRWDAATEHLERALDRNPYYIMTLMPLAEARLSAGIAALANRPPDPDTALTAFKQATRHANRVLELCPTFAMAEDLLGRVAAARAMAIGSGPNPEQRAAQATEAWTQARTHFNTALRLGARHTSDLYRQLAQVHLALNDYDSAEQALIRATQANPADDANWPLFYQFTQASKRYDGFKNALTWRITRLAEQDPPDTQNLATAYLWMADIEERGYQDVQAAQDAYQNAIHHTPRRPDTWDSYARFARRNDRLDAFKDYLIKINARIVEAGKEPLPHMTALGKVWKNGPDALLEASALLVAVVKGDVRVPGLSPAELQMPWALHILYEETMKADLPDQDRGITLFHLGFICKNLGELAMADAIFPAAMPLLSIEDQQVCAPHWADVLIRKGNVHEAVFLLKDIVDKAPQGADVRLAFARTLAKAGRTEEAKTQYGHYLRMPGITERERQTGQAELEALSK